MKKIRCPYGVNDGTFDNAMREVKNYYRFSASKSPFVVKTVDEAVISEPNEAKSIYILLPYFEKSLQDVINSNVLHDRYMLEQEVLKYFIGILRGVQVLHGFKRSGAEELDGEGGSENDAMLPNAEHEDMGTFQALGTELYELCPYAHRDLKPANVMLSAEGIPVLVDLGSCSKARVAINSRLQALKLTDFAQEHCTLPYRAPELLDVATNADISEATDIWSLGCMLYACCFGFSPFEKMEIDQGANLNLAISQGRYEFPENTRGYLQDLMDVIKKCLVLDPKNRPDVSELLDCCLQLSTS